MPRVEVERSIIVNAAITCESCGHQYQSKAIIKAEQSMFDPLTGNADLRIKLQKKLTKFNQNDYSELPNCKCPACGYTQSWNIKGSLKEAAENTGAILGGLIGLGIFISNLINRNNFLASIILSLLLAGVIAIISKPLLLPFIQLVYNPNRNKETAGKTIYPTITH